METIAQRAAHAIRNTESNPRNNPINNPVNNPVTQFIRRTYGSYIKVADRTPEQIDAINVFKQERDMEHIHPVTGNRMSRRTLAETQAWNAKYNPRYNHTRSTIDGFRTTRAAHIKAGRIEAGTERTGYNRPTTKIVVPEPREYTPSSEPRFNLVAMRKALRINKMVDHDRCELTWYGPVTHLEFCHTLSVSECLKRGEPGWAADDNNGFFLLGGLNYPMTLGFHWTVEGVYAPPEGEDYPEWMKRLGVPDARIEPTPEQMKYILLAQKHWSGAS